VLPANAFHARLVLVSGGALLAASAAGLQPEARVVTDVTFAIALGLGGIAGGFIADRAGRRPVVLAGAVTALADAVLWAVLGLVSAVLAGETPAFRAATPAGSVPTLPSGALPLLASVTAALGAFGCGVLLVAAVTLVAETAPVRGRAVLVLALAPFIAAGSLVPPAAAVVPALLFALALRRWLPESPRWLLARGRAVEADAVVRRAERAGGAPAITLARVAPVAPLPAHARDLARSGVTGVVLAVLLAHAAGAGAAVHLALAVALGPAALLVWLEGAATPRRASAAGLGVAVFASGTLDSNALGAAAAGMLALVSFSLSLALRSARARSLEAPGRASITPLE